MSVDTKTIEKPKPFKRPTRAKLSKHAGIHPCQVCECEMTSEQRIRKDVEVESNTKVTNNNE